jgi:mono/diheme cytochrome c family protein
MQDSIERGGYLTQILGCGRCHTEGELLGNRAGEWLAGSSVGIAYTEAREGESPGIQFPGNLTSDRETGLGDWSKEEIVRMIKSGINHRDELTLRVMPWPAYSMLTDKDANAIADYLRSLPAVRRQIPENIPKGEASPHGYVRFGIYTFSPGGNVNMQTLPRKETK